MTRDEALALVQKHTKNQNLVRHMLAVEAVMGALAKKFGGNKASWELAGILHDADYEYVKANTSRHTHQTLEWLKTHDLSRDVKDAIASHAWKYVPDAPEPKTQMEWALYTCDELTGLIVAVALVKGKKLSEVTVDSILKKWEQNGFAAGVNRAQIEFCQDKLGTELKDFIAITLKAMQNISNDLLL